jgi:uncharacterized membrane protein YphA (DoxX/SURF4 family)
MSCVQMFVNELHSLEWLGILLARVAVGLLFFLSGLRRALGTASRLCSRLPLFKERLVVRPQVDFQTPRTAILPNEVPVGVGNRFRFQ